MARKKSGSCVGVMGSVEGPLARIVIEATLARRIGARPLVSARSALATASCSVGSVRVQDMDSLGKETVLALDLGTTSAKALVIGLDGRVFARAEEPIETAHPAPGVAEQDVEQALEAARRAVVSVASLCGGRPGALVLACAMHGVVPLDRDSRPLAPMRTWADARGESIAQELRATDAWRGLQERTGTPVHASSPMCKIAAMCRHDRDLFGAAASFVSLKEFVLRRIADAPIVDASLASATGMMDLARGDWDDNALAHAGIDASRLSRIVSPRHVETGWRNGMAARFGLDARTPIVIGGSDGCLANLGLGAVRHGIAAASFGTSAAVRVATRRPRVRADSGLFCYVLDDGVWITGAAVNDMGNAVQWLADLLFAEAPPSRRVSALIEAAGGVPEGARGARFVAGLAGSRFPDYQAVPRGTFSGLALAHGRNELARALLEGVAAQLAGPVDVLRAEGHEVSVLRVGGGLTRSRVFRAILDPRAGAPIDGVDVPDATAQGAAILARAALDGRPLEGVESLR